VSRSVVFRAPNWLGDAVLATVVPPALKRRDASARVTVLAPRGLGDVYRAAAHVDEAVEFDRRQEVDAYRRGRYDLALLGPTSFGTAWRAWRARIPVRAGFATSRRGILLNRTLPGREYRRDRHQAENYRALARLVGEPSQRDDSPRVALLTEWERAAAELWPPAGRLRVALQPGATYGPAKRWPAHLFAELGSRLVASGRDVAVLGGPGDADVTAAVRESAVGVRDLGGRTRVGVLAAVLSSADVLVTNDTGPMHLAAAVGTRVVAIFGSTSPTWTGPYGDGHRVVAHPVPCAPCFQRTCEIGYVCLDRIEVDQVEREVQELLRGGGR
jgi:heptosyltransferase-2